MFPWKPHYLIASLFFVAPLLHITSDHLQLWASHLPCLPDFFEFKVVILFLFSHLSHLHFAFYWCVIWFERFFPKEVKSQGSIESFLIFVSRLVFIYGFDLIGKWYFFRMNEWVFELKWRRPSLSFLSVFKRTSLSLLSPSHCRVSVTLVKPVQ